MNVRLLGFFSGPLVKGGSVSWETICNRQQDCRKKRKGKTTPFGRYFNKKPGKISGCPNAGCCSVYAVYAALCCECWEDELMSICIGKCEAYLLTCYATAASSNICWQSTWTSLGSTWVKVLPLSDWPCEVCCAALPTQANPCTCCVTRYVTPLLGTCRSSDCSFV